VNVFLRQTFVPERTCKLLFVSLIPGWLINQSLSVCMPLPFVFCFLLFLSCTAAAAFAPGSALPASTGLRLTGNAGPVCFLSEGAAKAEPLTVSK
jgi:hypothetical protein